MAYQKRTLIKLHRELWQWLADNPMKHKSDWPEWVDNGGDIEDLSGANCFACYFHERKYGNEYLFCENRCLFVWATATCNSKTSEFGKWEDARTNKLKKFWAEKIRDLKVNPIYK